MKSQFGFLKRYFWIIGLIAQAAFVAWCFAIFGSIFSSMPRNYQWILAILTPLIQIAANKFTLKVAYQSADPSSKGKSTTKLTSIHYMTQWTPGGNRSLKEIRSTNSALKKSQWKMRWFWDKSSSFLKNLLKKLIFHFKLWLLGPITLFQEVGRQVSN